MNELGPSRYKIEIKNDWCHVCGCRRQIAFADVWRPQNAEHERDPGRRAQYLRVCRACLQTLADAAASLAAR